MYCINTDTTDPFFNLAIEEILLKNSEEEFLILYVNDPSVIIGKHQSGHREVNTRFVTENNIPVVRRISGGGTVFHDHGNLNYSFIRQSESGKQVDFRKYTQPVIDFLKSVGVEALFEGKNDLKVDGFKISGNAEHVYHNRVLHHGTLLFNTSLDILRNSIRKDNSCFTSRAVASNPSPVVNISTIIDFRDIHEFRSEMLNYFLSTFPGIIPYELSTSEVSNIESLSNSKFRTWEWNWAYGPEYTFIRTFKIKGVPHRCTLFVKDGIVNKSSIEGSVSLKEVSRKLIGCKHMVRDFSEFFRNENIILTEEEIYNFF